MATRIYSTRFLAGRQTGGSQSINVPIGHRAVVRFCSAIFFDASTAYFLISVAGVPILWRVTPAQHVVDHRVVMAVAYAGETISMTCAGGDAGWHVNGFLFADP